MQECRNEGAISLAEVRTRVDPGRSGSFKAKIVAEGNTEQDVYYVTPYASNGEGAFIAVPEVGAQILVCKVTGGTSWYYLGATFAPEPRDAQGDPIADADVMPFERPDPNIYKARGTPMKYLFKSPLGAGITVSDEYNPKFFNAKTVITSGQGKKIVLSDAPTIDAITLDSGNGSKITIADNPLGSVAARSVEIETVGPQKYINKESSTDIVVHKGGKELSLLNLATNVDWGPFFPCGNVNIQSTNNDVNVFTQAKKGSIFIECLDEDGEDQQIVIETNGSDGAITVKTNGKINLEAGQAVNIKAPEINFDCDKFSVNAEDIQMQSNQVNIDPGEGTIELANGADPEFFFIPSPQSLYFNRGVTTY